MKKLNIYFSLFFAVLISFGASGQESLRGLESRPMSKLYPGKTQQSRSAAQSLSMNLPFLDDFSAKSPLPSSNLWIDADVFVNNQFGIFAPSYGVATFDALDGEGAFYTNAGAFQFSADKLTSVFVNLSTNVPSDSIYFSFFYQPQGSGNDPETKDSLVLQFMSEYRADTLINTNVIPPDTTFIDKWVDMWSSQGMPLDSFRRHNQDKWFGLVMIPVTNPVFFKNTFRFRFFNYASLASNNIPSWQANCDEWNIDYVYMNEGRTIYDTAFNDITIVNEGTSFLKNYSAMPFRQFAAAAATEMRDSTEMLISNLGTAQVPSSYQFNIKDMSNNSIFNYPGGSWNLAPFATSGYQTYAPHRFPKFTNFNFPVTNDDSSSYLITHYIAPTGTTQELVKSNDTVYYMQRFLNYYAYDDGIPELGYGLSPSGSQLAYRFHVNVADTLKGMLICFNKTFSEANEKNFYIAVWADNGGKPGDLIWRNKTTRHPMFNDTSLYSYYAFDAETPIIFSDASTFYVGVIQTTDDNLNIGFDVNNNAGAKIYYNVAGNWENTAYSGSLMIRPVVGPNFSYTNKIVEQPENGFSIVPNPNRGVFSLSLDPNAGNYQDFRLRVYTSSGQLVDDLPYMTSYELSGLEKGIYFLEFSNSKTHVTYRGKMIHFK